MNGTRLYVRAWFCVVLPLEVSCKAAHRGNRATQAKVPKVYYLSNNTGHESPSAQHTILCATGVTE